MERRQEIAILNRSKTVTDERVEEITNALQKQLDDDFSTAWGIGAQLKFLGKDQNEGWEGLWNVVVLDTSDEANASGYHDLTPDGLPVGKCFAEADESAGASVSVTMSHELLEMLVDPGINLLVPDDDGWIYAYENCDPVGADDHGYEIDGVLVSDFVHPEWFLPSFRELPDKQFDHLGHVSAPFELAPGGYISRTKVWPPTWEQNRQERDDEEDKKRSDALKRPPVGSRRERRRTDRRAWARSRS